MTEETSEFCDEDGNPCGKCDRGAMTRESWEATNFSTCIKCHEKFLRSEMHTLGGGGPACMKCADEIDEFLHSDEGPTMPGPMEGYVLASAFNEQWSKREAAEAKVAALRAAVDQQKEFLEDTTALKERCRLLEVSAKGNAEENVQLKLGRSVLEERINSALNYTNVNGSMAIIKSILSGEDYKSPYLVMQDKLTDAFHRLRESGDHVSFKARVKAALDGR